MIIQYASGDFAAHTNFTVLSPELDAVTFEILFFVRCRKLQIMLFPLTFSGNNPGIQRDASAAGKTRRRGARTPSAVSTPRSVSAETMRRDKARLRECCRI